MKTKDYGRYVEFYPYKGETFYSVTLYKPQSDFGESGATVNWGCHGDETPERAELFGKAIVAAAEMARQLNKEAQAQQTTQQWRGACGNLPTSTQQRQYATGE